MNKSGTGGSAGNDQENTKYAATDNTKYASPADTNVVYAQSDENTKYARTDDENTKYAQPEEHTKYARADEEHTKYAQLNENTKYAQLDENTKYARATDEHTKYAGGTDSSRAMSPLVRRRAADAAIEEALMSVSAAIDRILPGISNESRARLIGTLIEKFGSELLEAHLGVTRSDRGR